MICDDMDAVKDYEVVEKRKVKYTSDWTLWACYIILCVVSVIEVFSASSLDLKNGSVYLPIESHVKFLLMGLVAMLVLEHIHYKYFKGLMLLAAPLSILLAVVVALFGESVGGASRAIEIGGLSLQAAEPCKFTVVLLLAYLLARFQKREGGLSTKGILLGFGVMFLYVALLITQGGSNAFLIMLVSCLMMIIAGLPKRLLVVGWTCVALAVGSVLWLHFSGNDDAADAAAADAVAVQSVDKKKENSSGFLKRLPVWKSRIDDWLGTGVPEYKKPTVYDHDGNSQRHHASMAIANGRGIGVGPGNSRECSRLQLAFSDFIYAIILEELGLAGGIIVLLCYIGIVIRAGMIGTQCKNAYSTLLIMGMALMISMQALYHMGISVGLLPVSGQPLPFISKGGTSILVMSMAMGIMLSVSRYAVEHTSEGLRGIDADDELPHDLRADNPSGVM